MKNLLLTFTILFTISSCNQIGLGAGAAIKNIFTAPYRGISNLISKSKYSDIAEKSSKSSPKLTCSGDSVSLTGDVEGIAQLQDAVRENVCSCSPWGSCSTSECSCEKLCPSNFDIFKRPEVSELSDLSKLENSLSFKNGGGNSKYAHTQGYCWGHASVTTQFNRMAFFKPNQKPKYDLKNSKDEQEYYKAIEYYKEQIDKIVDNKPADFPGISNLFELSSHRELQSYIADKVATSWADRAMTFSAAAVAVSAKPMSEKWTNRFINDVEEKIKLNQQPQVVFTKKNDTLVTHTLLISHIKEERGIKKLCVRDNNVSRYALEYDEGSAGYKKVINPELEKKSVDCKSYMVKKDDGSLEYIDSKDPLYRNWGDLGFAKVGHNDDADALEQYENLLEKCNSDKGCSK